MRHFLRLLVTRRWGWTVIAALIILGGILWGVSSPLIPYDTSPGSSLASHQIFYYATLANNGDIYLWPDVKTSPTFYVARHEDFNPPIDRTQIHLGGQFNFVDRSDTISVNEDLAAGVHVTQAHIIEQLTLYDASGRVTGTYNAADYNPSAGGYFVNRWWPGGDATIAAGLLIAALALFARRKKRAGKAPDQSDPNWPYVSIAPYPTLTPDAKP